MVKDALTSSFSLYRPQKASGYDGAVTYTRARLDGVKLAQPSRGWTVDSAGATRSVTATLYYNFGKSAQNPTLTPIFERGDILTDVSEEDVPIPSKFIVQAVTEHTFKGIPHHLEVVLV